MILNPSTPAEELALEAIHFQQPEVAQINIHALALIELETATSDLRVRSDVHSFVYSLPLESM